MDEELDDQDSWAHLGPSSIFLVTEHEGQQC